MNQNLCVRRDVEFNESDFGQKSLMSTEPDPKSKGILTSLQKTKKK